MTDSRARLRTATPSMAFTEFARQLIRGCHLWTRCRWLERGDCDLRGNEYKALKSSGLTPPSPPAEKAAARKDQTRARPKRDYGA
jgi:hypothetical protein